MSIYSPAADRSCGPGPAGPALDADLAAETARMFKALGDPVRLRILSLIARHEGGQCCVCEITPAFALSQPTISHHLKTLREAGLLDSERRGTWVYYRVIPAALERLSAVLAPAGELTIGTVGAAPDRICR